MHANPSDKLVMMANQIAKNLAIQGEDRAILEMSSHISRYWEPRMRETMKAYVLADGSALDPLAIKSLQVIWPGLKPGKSQAATAAAPAASSAKASAPAAKAPAATKPAKKPAKK